MAEKPKTVEQPKPTQDVAKVAKVAKFKKKKRFTYTERDIDRLSDEELESAIMSGDVRFDEDEL